MSNNEVMTSDVETDKRVKVGDILHLPNGLTLFDFDLGKESIENIISRINAVRESHRYALVINVQGNPSNQFPGPIITVAFSTSQNSSDYFNVPPEHTTSSQANVNHQFNFVFSDTTIQQFDLSELEDCNAKIEWYKSINRFNDPRLFYYVKICEIDARYIFNLNEFIANNFVNSQIIKTWIESINYSHFVWFKFGDIMKLSKKFEMKRIINKKKFDNYKAFVVGQQRIHLRPTFSSLVGKSTQYPVPGREGEICLFKDQIDFQPTEFEDNFRFFIYVDKIMPLGVMKSKIGTLKQEQHGWINALIPRKRWESKINQSHVYKSR